MVALSIINQLGD